MLCKIHSFSRLKAPRAKANALHLVLLHSRKKAAKMMPKSYFDLRSAPTRWSERQPPSVAASTFG